MIPTTGTCATLDNDLKNFFSQNPDLHLGGSGDFHDERNHHAQVLYPSSEQQQQKNGKAAVLIYFHGGGYTVYAVEYRLVPVWRFPTQLDEYACVLQWIQGKGGKARGVHPDRVYGGGDSAGGNMTAALSLRLRDEGKKPLKAQILLYPEARLPFDTLAATENNLGYYLECRRAAGIISWSMSLGNGIFSFADHHLPRSTPPSHPHVSPSMQPLKSLKGVPPAAVFTCEFDPLRDVGVEHALKLDEADNEVKWLHFDTLTHSFLQMALWSHEAMATTNVGQETKRLANSSGRKCNAKNMAEVDLLSKIRA
ncbi:MAG: hypothetical protein MMC33_009493, partial [Icmadophila ericetorum]|nr:hypothetical protein [Icmadophila ericetorum]